MNLRDKGDTLKSCSADMEKKCFAGMNKVSWFPPATWQAYQFSLLAGIVADH